MWDARNLEVEAKLDLGGTSSLRSLPTPVLSLCHTGYSSGNLVSAHRGDARVSVWNYESNIFRGLKCKLSGHEHGVTCVKSFRNALFT